MKLLLDNQALDKHAVTSNGPANWVAARHLRNAVTGARVALDCGRATEFLTDTSILLNPKIGNNHGLIHHLTGSLSAGQILRSVGVIRRMTSMRWRSRSSRTQPAIGYFRDAASGLDLP